MCSKHSGCSELKVIQHLTKCLLRKQINKETEEQLKLKCEYKNSEYTTPIFWLYLYLFIFASENTNSPLSANICSKSQCRMKKGRYEEREDTHSPQCIFYFVVVAICKKLMTIYIYYLYMYMLQPKLNFSRN